MTDEIDHSPAGLLMTIRLQRQGLEELEAAFPENSEVRAMRVLFDSRKAEMQQDLEKLEAQCRGASDFVCPAYIREHIASVKLQLDEFTSHNRAQ